MSSPRIQIWDFKTDDQLEKKMIQQLDETKCLENTYQGLLREKITSKITPHIEQYFPHNAESIKLTACNFLFLNDFFNYEMIKNAYDAKADNVYAFVNEQKDTVTTTLVDDGTGLASYFEKTLYDAEDTDPPAPTRYTLTDAEGCLDYFRIIDQDYDSNDPESKKNLAFKQEKIVSDKKIAADGIKKQAGGKGEGLKRIALFIASADGSFLMMDVKDLKKSPKYLAMSGITDIKSLPEKGAVFIMQTPKFSAEFKKNYDTRNGNNLLVVDSLENAYYLKMHPSKVGNLASTNKWRRPSIVDLIPDPLSPTNGLSPTNRKVATLLSPKTPKVPPILTRENSSFILCETPIVSSPKDFPMTPSKILPTPSTSTSDLPEDFSSSSNLSSFSVVNSFSGLSINTSSPEQSPEKNDVTYSDDSNEINSHSSRARRDNS
jgi:hypothetical protein